MVQSDLDTHGEQVESEDEHEGTDGADSMWEHPSTSKILHDPP